MAKIVKFHEKGGPEVLTLEEVTLLSVAENDVRFRVHAIGLNRAESMYRKGAHLQDYTWPSRVGYEASDVVEAIGKNVTGFAPGDAVSVVPRNIRMATYGTYGEVADMPANCLARNSDGFCTQMQRRHGFSTGRPTSVSSKLPIKSGVLKPVIAKTFPLAQIVESHRYLESNEQIGKIVVTV